jgi:hypothetical protein
MATNSHVADTENDSSVVSYTRFGFKDTNNISGGFNSYNAFANGYASELYSTQSGNYSNYLLSNSKNSCDFRILKVDFGHTSSNVNANTLTKLQRVNSYCTNNNG